MPIKKTLKNLAIWGACATILRPRTMDQIPGNTRRIRCSSECVSLLMNSTNNVLRLDVDGNVYYFRECKRHTQIKDYVQEQIDIYYTCVAPAQHEDKTAVLKSLSNRKNFRKFVNMGMTNDLHSGAYRFCMGEGGAHIGLEPQTPEQEERLKGLVQFVWGDLYGYMLNSGVKTGYYQTYNAVRSIATYRMAKLLGLQRLIPQTEYAAVYIDGKPPLFGTVMEQAPGNCVEHCAPEIRMGMVSPALQRDLTALNYLDVICLERDHRLGNYNVILEQGAACGIVAFDNDSPKSFSIGGISFFTYMGCTPLIKKGKLNRPYADVSLESNLERLNARQIYGEMKGLLNVWQIVALWARIRKLRKVLRRVPAERKLSECDWSGETIVAELNGGFGKTYLKHFTEKQEKLYQPWISNGST